MSTAATKTPATYLPGTGICFCGCGRPTNRHVQSRADLGVRRGDFRQFLPGHHSRGKKGPANGNFKGGRVRRPEGYVEVLRPRPTGGGSRYALEHVLIVERALGHPLLPPHCVHHVDLDRSNNANNNLVACEDQAYHSLLHVRQRALDECGNPSHRRCTLCQRYDAPENLVFYVGTTGIHRACRNERNRAYRAARRMAGGAT